jgi:Flp pilus assembly protein TadD
MARPAGIRTGMPLFAAAALPLVLTVLWAFWPLAGNGFIQFDDQLYIVGNPHVRSGLSAANAVWAMTSAYASNWHPLTWISHQLDVTLFGLDAGRHHLMGLALHLASALALLSLLWRLTGRLWRSALVAALFALHPLHVESVAWASERKDLLAGLLWFATIAAYLRYVRRPSALRYLPLVLIFALGLAAKPMLVTLPLVLLLLDYWPLGRLRPSPSGNLAGVDRRPPARLLLEKVPLLLLSALGSALTLWAQSRSGALYPLARLPFAERIANALAATAGYLVKMLLPLRLSYFYPLPAGGPPVGQIAAAALLIAGLFAAALLLRRRPYLIVGWLWFLVMLVPVVGIVQVGTQALADRYTYLPLTGIFVAFVWGAAAVVARRTPPVQLAVAVVCVMLLACAAVLTRAQVGYWRDTGTLAEHALALDPDNWMALDDRGIALSQQGRHDEARAAMVRSIAVYPGYDAAHNNLGVVELRLGRPAEALRRFDETIALNPRYREAWGNRGLALLSLGRNDEAEASFQQLLSVDPGSPEAHKQLGNIQLDRRQYREAAGHYQAALQLRPDLPEVWNNLGIALLPLGRREEALAALREALRQRPAFSEARRNLERALASPNDGRVALPAPGAFPAR